MPKHVQEPQPLACPGPEELALMPLAEFTGLVLLAETPAEAGECLARLSGEAILGFDTESRPTFTKGATSQPSLVQLAGQDVVVLLRLEAFAAWETLAAVLGDPTVVKAGVAVRDDVAGLSRIRPLSPAGFVDVGEWARKLGWPMTGLRNLAGALLGLRVSKKARLSNWAARRLTAAQVRYAATDAWVSREIYLRMGDMAQKNSPSRALPEDRLCPD